MVQSLGIPQWRRIVQFQRDKSLSVKWYNSPEKPWYQCVAYTCMKRIAQSFSDELDDSGNES
jgi:hypothetical protein